MAWTLHATGHPYDGEPRKWRGSLSSSVLPHGVLACRAAVLNLLAEGVESGVREWAAVGAITRPRASRKPIAVAYADVHVPALIDPITDEQLQKRTVFDLLVKMSDPGRTISELEALAALRGSAGLGRGAISTLLDLSRQHRPTPSVGELLYQLYKPRIY